MKKAIKNIIKSIRFNLSASNCFLFILYYKLIYKPKKGSLAYFIDKYSNKNKSDFTVIQIGANDGITHDPIHKYIKRDKWNGVLLEPQKYIYDNFLKPIYSKNKEIITYNAALGNIDGVTNLYKISFSNERWATGIASFNKDSLENAFKSGHVMRSALKNGVKIPSNKEDLIITESVEVISPNTLISKFNLKKIDLLQIDAEGYDFEIIKMFDFDNIKPKAICFENSHLTENDYRECTEYLLKFGYYSKTIKADTIAVLDKDILNYD